MALDPTIVRFFEGKGYPRQVARGIAAGISAESSNDHTIKNDKSGAHGLGQWLGPRKAELYRRFGRNPSKEQQLEFLHYELQGGDKGGSAVLGARTETAALQNYITKFMRPARGHETTSDIRRGRQALGQTGGGDPASSRGGTAFDRAQAARQQNTGPSMQSVYQAYRNTGKSGGMTPQEAAQYEKAVLDGHVMLPRGASIRAKPASPVVPKTVVEAYNSHRMDDDPDARAELKRAVDAGEVSLPRGMKLQAPAPRTMTERLGMGVRPILEGAGGLVDVVAGPANAIINALPGEQGLSTTPFRDLGRYASDQLGLAKPESDTENLINATIEGGSQGLLTAGAALPLAGGTGATGTIARAVGSSPILDTISGAASGASAETARQAGAGPVGQVVAGLVGGAVPVGAATTVARVKAPKSLPEVVQTTPRAAVMDETGNLTPEGQEIAARHNVSPEEIVKAYEAPPTVQRATANEQLPEARARVSGEAEPVVDPVAEPVPTREAPGELPPQPNSPNADDGGIPTARVNPAAATPEALPATALDRVQQAREFGVDMSRGQATKNFDVQDAESRLRNSNGPEAEQMRQFTAQQAEQVKAAVEDLRAAAGDTSMTAEQRGVAVQEAVRELRDLGQQGVRELYKQARELGQAVPLDTAGIQQVYDRLMVEANVPSQLKEELTEQAAKYGLIGKAEGTAENGITTVKIDDGAGGTRAVRFYGEPDNLRLDNAEDLRQVVSKMYQTDGGRKLTQMLKSSIDDATEEAATKLAQYNQTGAQMPDALSAARQAHQTQTQTFKAKDVVQSIADWKKGTQTDVLSPEQVMQRALAKTSDLKRVKAVLLTKPTLKSKAAWRAIQAHGLAEIFQKATTQNANIAGEVTDAISGAKLRSAIQTFGADKLGVLLDPPEFNRLMKLKRVIEDVTIPIAGTTNPSGSGNLLMRLAKDVDNQVTAAFGAAGMAVGGPAGAAVGGTIGRTISPAIKGMKEARANAETLEGVTNYTPERAAADTGEAKPSVASQAGAVAKQAGVNTVKAFIETYGSPRVLAPVLAATTGSQEQ